MWNGDAGVRSVAHAGVRTRFVRARMNRRAGPFDGPCAGARSARLRRDGASGFPRAPCMQLQRAPTFRVRRCPEDGAQTSRRARSVAGARHHAHVRAGSVRCDFFRGSRTPGFSVSRVALSLVLSEECDAASGKVNLTVAGANAAQPFGDSTLGALLGSPTADTDGDGVRDGWTISLAGTAPQVNVREGPSDERHGLSRSSRPRFASLFVALSAALLGCTTSNGAAPPPPGAALGDAGPGNSGFCVDQDHDGFGTGCNGGRRLRRPGPEGHQRMLQVRARRAGLRLRARRAAHRVR